MLLLEPQSSITEVAVDGGKVRLRTPEVEASYWQDYRKMRKIPVL